MFSLTPNERTPIVVILTCCPGRVTQKEVALFAEKVDPSNPLARFNEQLECVKICFYLLYGWNPWLRRFSRFKTDSETKSSTWRESLVGRNPYMSLTSNMLLADGQDETELRMNLLCMYARKLEKNSCIYRNINTARPIHKPLPLNSTALKSRRICRPPIEQLEAISWCRNNQSTWLLLNVLQLARDISGERKSSTNSLGEQSSWLNEPEMVTVKRRLQVDSLMNRH